jgi:hypothetical protein
VVVVVVVAVVAVVAAAVVVAAAAEPGATAPDRAPMARDCACTAHRARAAIAARAKKAAVCGEGIEGAGEEEGAAGVDLLVLPQPLLPLLPLGEGSAALILRGCCACTDGFDLCADQHRRCLDARTKRLMVV